MEAPTTIAILPILVIVSFGMGTYSVVSLGHLAVMSGSMWKHTCMSIAFIAGLSSSSMDPASTFYRLLYCYLTTAKD